MPVTDSFDDSLSVLEDGEGSLDPLQRHLQGLGQFWPFGRNLLHLEGGHWLVGVPVESRERGVEGVQAEIEIVNNYIINVIQSFEGQ